MGNSLAKKNSKRGKILPANNFFALKLGPFFTPSNLNIHTPEPYSVAWGSLRAFRKDFTVTSPVLFSYDGPNPASDPRNAALATAA
jgi:hypothetical protein